MSWLVSGRYARFLEQTIERLQKERDEQQIRADRALDQLAMSHGYEPSTPRVRDEMKDASTEAEKLFAEMQLEDTQSGMIAEEIIAMAETAST